MAIQRTGKNCKHCGDRKPAERNRPNHILHLLLTLVTAGLWVFVWFLLCITSPHWRCTACGSRV